MRLLRGRRWLQGLCLLVIAVLPASIAYVTWPSEDQPAVSTIPPFASAGVQPYGAASPVDWEAYKAVDAHRQYPEYYKCRAYPSDANLTQADLVPTANVVVTITYDKHSKKYVVSGDPRITVHETDSRTTQTDGGHLARMQEFGFSFAGGVHYFGTFSRYTAGDGLRWGAVTLYGTDQINGRPVPNYYLPLSPGNGPSDPMYVIIATDTRTCHAGKVSVPAEFSWAQLANNGLLMPEYYDAGNHPQG